MTTLDEAVARLREWSAPRGVKLNDSQDGRRGDAAALLADWERRGAELERHFNDPTSPCYPRAVVIHPHEEEMQARLRSVSTELARLRLENTALKSGATEDALKLIAEGNRRIDEATDLAIRERRDALNVTIGGLERQLARLRERDAKVRGMLDLKSQLKVLDREIDVGGSPEQWAVADAVRAVLELLKEEP